MSPFVGSSRRPTSRTFRSRARSRAPWSRRRAWPNSAQDDINRLPRRRSGVNSAAAGNVEKMAGLIQMMAATLGSRIALVHQLDWMCRNVRGGPDTDCIPSTCMSPSASTSSPLWVTPNRDGYPASSMLSSISPRPRCEASRPRVRRRDLANRRLRPRPRARRRDQRPLHRSRRDLPRVRLWA